MNPKEIARKLLGKPPNPGSDEALDMGCECPILDNFHGAGVSGMFWVNEDCPLHGKENDGT